jgi:hypothetical protein
MSKRLFQIAVLVMTVYFAVDAGQRTGWSPKAYVGALIALSATILTFVVKDYWIVSRSSRRTTDATW